jgi:hypothetical protein
VELGQPAEIFILMPQTTHRKFRFDPAAIVLWPSAANLQENVILTSWPLCFGPLRPTCKKINFDPAAIVV